MSAKGSAAGDPDRGLGSPTGVVTQFKGALPMVT